MPVNRFARTSGALFLGACAAGLVAAQPASAHHSGAMYDSAKSVTISGVVSEFNWTNPHTTMVIEMAGPDGKAQAWDIEGGSPNTLIKQGWRKSSFKPGDKVSITIHPMRNGAYGGSFMNAVLADGSVLPQARAPTPRAG